MNVVIVYNPHSTGDGKANAKRLAEQLTEKGVKVALKETTHAGHGEEIAAAYAHEDKEVILISSSGDGGYHEVVNGVLAHPSTKVTVGVLPSGNANDHYSALGGGALVEAIARHEISTIDVIKVTATIDGKPWVRYAHSYAGIGVTATAAKRLTEERPNIFTEKWIVAHALFSFRYVKLREDGELHRYSSLLFGNIDRMSKVIKLSDSTSVTDGKFEMSGIRFHSKLRLLAYLLTAATLGLRQARSLHRYTFGTLSKTPIQLDGEVYTIDADCTVTIESMKQVLRCVI